MSTGLNTEFSAKSDFQYSYLYWLIIPFDSISHNITLNNITIFYTIEGANLSSTVVFILAMCLTIQRHLVATQAEGLVASFSWPMIHVHYSVCVLKPATNIQCYCLSHIQNTRVQKSPCMDTHSSQVNCNASSVRRSPKDFKTAQLGILNFQKKNGSPEDKMMTSETLKL